MGASWTDIVVLIPRPHPQWPLISSQLLRGQSFRDRSKTQLEGTEELIARVQARPTASHRGYKRESSEEVKRDPCPQSNWISQSLGACSPDTEYKLT